MPLHVLGAGLLQPRRARLEHPAKIRHRGAHGDGASDLLRVARDDLRPLDVGEGRHQVEHQRADVLTEPGPRRLDLDEEVPPVGHDRRVTHPGAERLHLLEELGGRLLQDLLEPGAGRVVEHRVLHQRGEAVAARHRLGRELRPDEVDERVDVAEGPGDDGRHLLPGGEVEAVRGDR